MERLYLLDIFKLSIMLQDLGNIVFRVVDQDIF